MFSAVDLRFFLFSLHFFSSQPLYNWFITRGIFWACFIWSGRYIWTPPPVQTDLPETWFVLGQLRYCCSNVGAGLRQWLTAERHWHRCEKLTCHSSFHCSDCSRSIQLHPKWRTVLRSNNALIDILLLRRLDLSFDQATIYLFSFLLEREPSTAPTCMCCSCFIALIVCRPM